jgi:hypothetical protein
VPVEVPLKVAGGFGTIVGHIEACDRKPPGRTVAGIVIVTHGVKAINHTTGQAIIEAGAEVSTQRVAVGDQYRFKVSAGTYVLEGFRQKLTPTGIRQYLTVAVIADRTVRADITGFPSCI